ncbi:PREDICTED: targeting protein for Xklp2 homolog [Nicrophorus vespilloides]|uniref:Targeting protein for Xklp2 homolog n=1 Tax=Nicrophorus vespilloides TaxID=110193 RepID=A0ABM1MW30_NICVS|nr:PREDICTED: targeting protein for Xklp2 homolog [Nicrophorus vespilloides]
MGENYDYDSPQFLDFETIISGNEDKSKLEEYFEFDHENPNKCDNKVVIVNIESSDSGPDLNESSTTESFSDSQYFSPAPLACNGMRKSLSMSCLPQDKPVDREPLEYVSNTLQNMKLNNPDTGSTKSIEIDCSEYKRGRANSASRLQKQNFRSNYLSQPKQLNPKYVSMAEIINKFHNMTPDRFRSKPKGTQRVTTESGPIACTIPKSPALTSKNRQRNVHVLTYEERQMQEFEEAKKHMYKANPVNVNALQGITKLGPCTRKPNTNPEPFKLTEVKKKVIKEPPVKEHNFHAKPVPKSVYECTNPVIKSSLLNYTKLTKTKVIKKEEPLKPMKPFTATRTKPAPFSFEMRDQRILQKKEQHIQKVIEEEKKARVFHANPLPKKILTAPQIKPKVTRYGSMESVKSNKSDDSILEPAPFKARPALVLKAKPFVPKKEERPLLEVSEFTLNTDRRAKERDEFDAKLKEMKERNEELMRQKEEEEMILAQMEVARLRKEAEHKAQPIKLYKDIKPVPPKPVTLPMTPKFRSGKSNKENIG